MERSGAGADADDVSDGQSGTGEDTGGQTIPAIASIPKAIPAPVVALDEAGDVVYANDAVENRFGYPASALTGEPIQRLCPDLSLEEIADSCKSASSETVRLETRGVDADGDEMCLEVAFDVLRGDPTRYVGIVHDVTRYRNEIRTLEQYERIVETVDDGVYVLDDAFNITSINDAVETMTGYSRAELVGSNASILADEKTLEQAATVSKALLAGESDAATISTTIQSADGEAIPIETRFSVYQFGDGSYGQVGVVRDVSERIRYEQTLTALHNSMRELLRAETDADVCDLIVNTATDVIDLSAAVIYLFDAEANVLRPSAVSNGFDATAGDIPLVSPDGGDLWEAFVRGEQRVDTDDPIVLGDTFEIPPESGMCVPLGDHGVFFVATADTDRIGPDTVELIDIVAASAEAALERVDREVRLRERDREHRRQNERLTQLKRINEIIRRIDQALVGANSREEIEQSVTAQLARFPAFSLAWIGRVSSGEVVPEAWAGNARGYLDDIDRSMEDDDGPPSVQTARSDAITVVPSIADDLRSGRWRTEAISRDLQSAISVPLRQDGITHAVLTVYASEQAAFSDTLRSVFAELGETIAHAYPVVETKQWLSAEAVVELDLRIRAPESPLSRLAAETGAKIHHEGSVPSADGSGRTFARIEGADAATVRAAADGSTATDSIRMLTERDDDGRFEVYPAAPTVATALADRGARVQSLTADGSGVKITVEVMPTTDVREFVEALDDRYAAATLVARRDLPIDRTRSGFRATVEERLTDRQHQILRTAFLSGYFEWPRTTTGEEIAETFDVSQPTINRHLRVSERKLLELLFDEE